jgi:hypothetical protein
MEGRILEPPRREMQVLNAPMISFHPVMQVLEGGGQ